jgi:anaerobic magnesium-protoporphyrin IX monomethyl ester cyclase
VGQVLECHIKTHRSIYILSLMSTPDEGHKEVSSIMKVLLIYPRDEENINTRLPGSLNRAQGLYPPLGLSYLAAVLEESNHDVRILDVPALNLTVDETRKEIFDFKADVAGVTCMTSTIKGSLAAARIAKESGAKVVLGGPQLAVYPEDTVSYDFVDYGVVGEGDYVMRDLVNALESGKNVSAIKGLVYKKGGRTHVNGFGLVDDLDTLPLPARHLLPMDNYDCVITKRPFVTMVSSRGCPYRCGFCFKQPSDTVVRFRSPERVVDEIEHCIDRYKTRWVMFYDDTLGAKREHVTGICNGILERGLDIEWETPMRVNNVDRELLQLMHKAGCRRLRYGVESGDEDILKVMRKGITIDKVREVFKITDEIGIETFAYFIIGYAHETPVTIRKTINLAKELDSDWTMFTVATPYPKTNLYDLALEAGIVKGDYWRDFTLGKKRERIPYFVEDSDKWVKQAYKEFYLRPKYVWKKLRRLRSLETLRKYIDGATGVVLFNMK